MVDADRLVRKLEGGKMGETKRGKFIVLEGIDGSGKTTQVEMLGRWLKEKGITSEPRREPGGTQLGEYLRSYLRNHLPVSRSAECLLFLASMAEAWAATIKPALERGDWVISDRWLLSTIVYGGIVHGLGVGWVLDAAGDYVPEPYLKVVLEVPINTAVKRIAKRTANNYYDCDVETLQKASQGYREHGHDTGHCVYVDATGTPEEVHERVKAAVMPLLQN